MYVGEVDEEEESAMASAEEQKESELQVRTTGLLCDLVREMLLLTLYMLYVKFP